MWPRGFFLSVPFHDLIFLPAKSTFLKVKKFYDRMFAVKGKSQRETPVLCDV